MSVQAELTPKLECCGSGVVDACGVCDGDASTCATFFDITLTEQPAGPRRLFETQLPVGADSAVRLDARSLLQMAAQDAWIATFETCLCTVPSLPNTLRIIMGGLDREKPSCNLHAAA